MSDRFVVELRKRTIGIAVRARGGFRFFASEPDYLPLERIPYPDLRAITADAEKLAAMPEAGQMPVPAVVKRRESVEPAPNVHRRLPVQSHPVAEEAPEWFRWAVVFGLAGTSALAGAVLAGPAQ